MFSDTHFHFNILEEESRQSVLEQMAANNTFFGMDIGTHCDDLARRQKLALDVISKIADEDKKKKAFNMYYFSAGIWPAPEAIRDRKNQIIELERQLKAALDNPNHFYNKVVAIVLGALLVLSIIVGMLSNLLSIAALFAGQS